MQEEHDMHSSDSKSEPASSSDVPHSNASTSSTPDDDKTVIGNIYDGVVTNITNFGAFVRLPNSEEGLVHISELANEFVTDINQHVALGDTVSVKVLGRNNKNKLDFSIKQALSAPESAAIKPSDPGLFLHRKSKNNTFEDKLGQFLKKSEEKQIDIRRNLKQKQGIVKKRK